MPYLPWWRTTSEHSQCHIYHDDVQPQNTTSAISTMMTYNIRTQPVPYPPWWRTTSENSQCHIYHDDVQHQKTASAISTMMTYNIRTQPVLYPPWWRTTSENSQCISTMMTYNIRTQPVPYLQLNDVKYRQTASAISTTHWQKTSLTAKIHCHGPLNRTADSRAFRFSHFETSLSN